MSDFSETIIRLENRSLKAKKKAFLVSLLVGTISIFILSILIAGLLFRTELIDNKNKDYVSERTSVAGAGKFESKIIKSEADAKLEQDIRSNMPPMSHILNRILDLSIKNKFSEEELRGYTDAFSDAVVKLEDRSSAMIVSGIFSAGAIGLAVLLLQISTNFIKYYIRVSELYDAQADALRLSDGNTDVALSMLKELSSERIEFGKTPLSVYEKAFEALSVVNKK